MLGISRRSVEIADLNPEDMVDALLEGRIDAAATWHPHLAEGQRELGANATVLYGGGIYTWAWNLVGKQSVIARRPEAIPKVLRALIRAEGFLREEPKEAHKIIARHMGLDESYVGRHMGHISFAVRLDQSLLTTLESQARWAMRKGLTDKTDIPNFLDHIYLPGLEGVKPEAVGIIR